MPSFPFNLNSNFVGGRRIGGHGEFGDFEIGFGG